jgi:hypothetical protein
MHASTERDLDAVFAKMVELGVGALAIAEPELARRADRFFLSRREQIIALAARNSLPATSPWSEALRRPHPQGREACQPAGSAVDEVPIDHQPEDREGTRH